MHLHCTQAEAEGIRDEIAVAAAQPTATNAVAGKKKESIVLFDRIRGKSYLPRSYALDRSDTASSSSSSSSSWCYWEWKIGTENLQIPNEVFVRGWRKFMEKRYEAMKRNLG